MSKMLTSDILIKLVVFRIHNRQLQVLYTRNHLPESSLITTMSLDDIAGSLFVRSTGVSLTDYYLEQLYTFSERQEVSICYYVLLGDEEVSISEDLAWIEIASIRENSNDADIIRYARQRLAWKVEYTNVIYSLLPKTFTLTQLQEVYEIVLGHKLDKRNFRKKIMSLDFIESTGEKRSHHARPAQVYRFISRKPVIVKAFS